MLDVTCPEKRAEYCATCGGVHLFTPNPSVVQRMCFPDKDGSSTGYYEVAPHPFVPMFPEAT